VILATGTRNRKVIIAGALAFALIVPAALFVLQQKRNVGFLDKRDGSTTWRMTVYREGVELLFSRPRHLLVGVGMDSIKRFRNQWGLFDNGRLPPGHFHSTPLQIAVERGLPALAVWFALLFIYGRMLWRVWRDGQLRAEGKWIERGLALGALGGLCGFFTSGLVHYNLGDSEVAMVFYFIMGCTLIVERQTRLRASEG
jgi:O-antigen ligase